MSAKHSGHPADGEGYITLDTFKTAKGASGGFGYRGANGTTGAQPQIDHDYPKWIDGFPHSFHGWGPATPDDAETTSPRSPGGDGEAGKAERISKADETSTIKPMMLFALQDFDPFVSTLTWTTKR